MTLLKKFLISLFLVFSLVTSVTATEVFGDAEFTGEYAIDPEEVVIGETVRITTDEELSMFWSSPAQEDLLEAASFEEEVSVASEGADTSTDGSASISALAPITADDTNGLKSVLLGILGDYEPILFEYTYGSNYNTGREVFQDDVWICSFWMLALLVYCIFRLLGGWLSRKQ